MALAIRTASVFFLLFYFSFHGSGQISLTLQVTNSVCGYGNGVVFAKVSGGTAPYSFSDNGGPAQPSPLFSGLTAGTHQITVVDKTGATVSATATLTNTFPPPVITVRSKTAPTDCNAADGRLTLGASAGTSPYTFGANGAGPQSSPVFTGLSPGYYTVSVTDNNGCKQSLNVVLRAPCRSAGATLNYSQSVCGATGFVTATPAAGASLPYAYSLEGTAYPATPYQSSGTFSNLPAGAYHLTIRDRLSRTAIYAFDIQQYCGLPATVNTQPEHCHHKDGTIEVNVSGGNPPIFYSTDGKNYQQSDVLTGQRAGKHTVYVIDAYLNADTLTTTIASDIPLTVDAGNPLQVCAGTSVRLKGSSSAADAQFHWSPASGLSDTSSPTPTASPADSTTYYLSATADNCTVSDSVKVAVDPLPVADAGSDTRVCYDQTDTLHGKGGATYHWSPSTYLSNASSSQPAVIHPEQSVTYQLTVTDSNGCSSADPAAVTVNVVPQAVVDAGEDTSILAGQSVTLHAQDVNNSGFTTWSWSPDAGLDNPASQDPIVNTDQEETYTVTAATESGCSAKDAIKVIVFSKADFFVPNAFTPNGDGHNDVLHVRPVGMRGLDYFAVYNRFGQQVYQSRDAAQGWDGRANGQQQPAGTYVWTVKGTDLNGSPVQRNGTVLLIR
ncbi:gliding motility-associated C-terminal domain-containing protein [Puia sp.]|uniref:gliding motility-associated C-terminal domain-containing protein n=1 Tax=Puia sp. TaxID=2045100 RepID=UPI002F41320F